MACRLSPLLRFQVSGTSIWGIEHIDLFNNGTIARLTAHSLLSEVKGNRIVEESGQRVSSKFYFPILVEPDYPLTRNGLYQWLRHENIFF